MINKKKWFSNLKAPEATFGLCRSTHSCSRFYEINLVEAAAVGGGVDDSK